MGYLLLFCLVLRNCHSARPGSLATGLTMTLRIRARTTMISMVLEIHAFIEGLDDEHQILMVLMMTIKLPRVWMMTTEIPMVLTMNTPLLRS